MQKITPFLWFDNNAEEAVNFYVSIFKNSKIGLIARYGEAGAKVSGKPKGTVMTIEFQLNGQEFIALNGGPDFRFTEAISFAVSCKTQQELDELWEKTLCWWPRRPVRLAERQIRSVLANHSRCSDRNVARPGH